MQVPFIFCPIHLQAHIHPTKEIRVCMQVVFRIAPFRVGYVFFSFLALCIVGMRENLVLLGCRLDLTGAGVSFGGKTADGLGVLRLWWRVVSFIFLNILDRSQAQGRKARLMMTFVRMSKRLYILSSIRL